MKLTEQIKGEILEHAKEEIPKESCGLIALVDGTLEYFPCGNVSAFPTESFALDGYEKVEDNSDEIIGLVHSHPNHSVEFSEVDKSACKESELIWFIVDPVSELWNSYDPCGISHKLGIT